MYSIVNKLKLPALNPKLVQVMVMVIHEKLTELLYTTPPVWTTYLHRGVILQFVWVSADPTFSQILIVQIPLFFYLFDNADLFSENLYLTLNSMFTNILLL